MVSPIVELTRIESFSAAHRLHSDTLTAAENVEIFGKCNNPNGHGHNYRWEVTLRGPINSTTGMVYNLAALKVEMAAVMDTVDHKNLDLDVDHFKNSGIVSTTENVAVYLYNALHAQMSHPDLLHKVKLYETDKNVFVYRGESK